MAVQTIGYGDKQFLNENSNIPATNKVQDTDMNEIKSVVNNNANEANNLINGNIYSTNEVNTNKVWIDGKPIYRKVINIGNLPNSTSKTINHNISNLDNFIDIRGTAIRATDKDTFSLPYVTFNPNNAGGIIFYVNETTIYVTTSSDRSNYNGKFILEYTKTTD